MLTLVIGGSGSGKSEYAEKIVKSLQTNGEDIYYLATMKPEGEENKRRILRHLQLRDGKGFITVEMSINVASFPQRIGIEKCRDAIVLLECMSNLAANEMFGEEIKSAADVHKKIVEDMGALNNKVKHLVVVSNNIHEDGATYDAMTEEYIRAVGDINSDVAAMSDKVIEVVVGIPIVVK